MDISHLLCELIDKYTDVYDSAEPDDWTTINLAREILDDLLELNRCGK